MKKFQVVKITCHGDEKKEEVLATYSGGAKDACGAVGYFEGYTKCLLETKKEAALYFNESNWIDGWVAKNRYETRTYEVRKADGTLLTGKDIQEMVELESGANAQFDVTNPETKDNAELWIRKGMPCGYRYGYGFKGASIRPITKEEALKKLPEYSFGKGFYSLSWIRLCNGAPCLEFNELSANDMY